MSNDLQNRKFSKSKRFGIRQCYDPKPTTSTTSNHGIKHMAFVPFGTQNVCKNQKQKSLEKTSAGLQNQKTKQKLEKTQKKKDSNFFF